MKLWHELRTLSIIKTLHNVNREWALFYSRVEEYYGFSTAFQSIIYALHVGIVKNAAVRVNCVDNFQQMLDFIV